jgi:hypothetical protein
VTCLPAAIAAVATRQAESGGIFATAGSTCSMRTHI